MESTASKKQRALVVSVKKDDDVKHYVNIGGLWYFSGTLSGARDSGFWGTSCQYFDKDGFWNDETTAEMLTRQTHCFASLGDVARNSGINSHTLRPYIRTWEA